ncbi:MAG: Hpt domain-containing protein [Phascolarctobacterium sp.]|nr:Hpt domain-containing protein [Phascolarctobacterium sp.]
MNIKEFYAKTSGNYEEAVGRMMKDSLVQRFVLKFANDKSFAELKENLATGNTEVAFRAAHTLKGVCKNLAFTKLADTASEITEMLRAGDLASAQAYFPNVEADYNMVIAAISEID